MDKLAFDIYVGNKMVYGQASNVIVVITPKFLIPKGKCKLDGSLLQNDSSYYFNSLYDAGTFIADWMDLFNYSNSIKATIYLNKLSLHKVYHGKEILNCLDKIDKNPNREKILGFDEL